MKFSKVTGGFYSPDVNYDDLPDDLISVSPDDYHRAMSLPVGESLDVIDGELVFVSAPPIDPAIIAARERSEAMYRGEEYAESGVMVPFRSDDALGLLQVKAAFDLGVSRTVIEFSNGQKLPMTPAEFPAFAKWFAEKRNSFYTE